MLIGIKKEEAPHLYDAKKILTEPVPFEELGNFYSNNIKLK